MAIETAEPEAGRFKPFAYLATQNAGLYRRVMLAFVAAKRRFVVHLRTEDVVAELTADGAAADVRPIRGRSPMRSPSSSTGATCAPIRTPAG